MKKKICKSCGAQLKLNMVYCPKCGVPVRPKTKTEFGKKKYRLLKNWKFWSLAALGLLLIIRIFGGVRYYLSGDVNLNAISRQLAMPDVEIDERDLVVMSANTALTADTSADAQYEEGSDAADASSQDAAAPEDSASSEGTGEGDEASVQETDGNDASETDEGTQESQEMGPPVSEATSVYQQTEGTETTAEETAADTEQDNAPAVAQNPFSGSVQETAQTVAEAPSVQPQATVQPQAAVQPQATVQPQTAAVQQTAAASAAEDQAAVIESQLAAYEYYLDQNLNYIFDGKYTLIRSGSNFNVSVWVNGAAAEMEAIRAGRITQSEWAVFKDSLSNRAASLYSQASTRGLTGVHMDLDFLNDTDLNRVLISYHDGVETYDALK